MLVVNPFYRVKKAPTAPEKANFDDPETRKMLMGLRGTLSAATAQHGCAGVHSPGSTGRPPWTRSARPAPRATAWAARSCSRPRRPWPDRIGAGATFHGGGLVTDQPDSPHLLIPKMKAHFLIAIAENDDQKQPDAKDVLRDAFAKAGLPAEIEVYAGTLHGWCPPDSAVYNAAQAEKAWERMLALFKSALA